MNPSSSSLPPSAPAAAPAAPLYARTADSDPERTAGSQTHYASFDDFVTTFEIEANDPSKVGAADVLDIINPLQHLPLISNLYREVTGDTIKPGARMIGGAVFGGGMGLASSSVNAVIEEETGHDLAGNVAMALAGEGSFNHRPKATTAAPQIAGASGLVHITWNSQPPGDIPHAHAIGAYRRAEAAGIAAAAQKSPYERVVMTDPERTAGTMVRYV